MPIMRNILRAVLALVTGTAALAGGEPVAENRSDTATLVRGNNQFALELYGQLSDDGGNIFLSPFSISSALAMTYGGAGGRTAEEMAAALRFPYAGRRLHPAFAKLLSALKGDKSQGYELSIANGLWADRRQRFKEEFKGLVRVHYSAELAELDFRTAAEQARAIINAWVEKQTHGKMRDLIPRGAVSELTRLVLANAIYFRGQWEEEFPKRATSDAPFKVTAEQEVIAPMMYHQDEFQLLEMRSFQALRLRYRGRRLAMVVFLPRKVEGLAEFEKSLTPEDLDSWLGNLKPREVQVYLPKFRVEAAFTLNKALTARGMPLAFSDQADFSGMTGGKDLFISLVIHKAFVDVDEKGTEAAAATAVIMAPTAAPPQEKEPPAVFRADHPFLFLIRDERSGSILFIGRVTNPKL